MVSLSVQISRLCDGHIPATTVVEDMIRISDRFDRDAEYVLSQCRNLQLGRKGLPQFHEACGYDAARCFKALLAYEYGFAHREELRREIFALNDAAFHGLEAIVNEFREADAELELA
jgi:hypothetical protein